MTTSPFLVNIEMRETNFPNLMEYPYNIPIFKDKDFKLQIKKPILIISGDNGTGKSTLLEIIASSCDFNINGGNKNHLYSGQKNDVEKILNNLKFSWKFKVNDGFFMRSDSFLHFANYIDEQTQFVGNNAYAFYGGKSLNEQSHGESFLSLFENRFTKRGIYILDEPEAALSPQKILVFIAIIKELADSGNVQFIISTHSPMLMAIPNSQFIYITDNHLEEKSYRETEHFLITKSFLDNPERFFKHLFDNEE